MSTTGDRQTSPERSALEATLQGDHLPALDGLRAVAVFVVIAYHGLWTFVPGDLGVTAFFVLSGFLITWLLLREHDRTGIGLPRFYLRRVLRIFPAYYAFVAASFAYDHLKGQDWPAGLTLAATTYTVNYYNATHGHPITSVAHAWSLGIEEQFYLLWPLLLIGLLRLHRVRNGLIAIIALIVAWRTWLVLQGAPSAYVYNAFETRFDSLAIGCLLATVTREAWFHRLAPWVAHWWLALITVVAVVAARKQLPHDWHYSVGFSIEALLIALLIVQLLQVYKHPAWSWLQNPVVRWLGLLSYSLYLWHVWGLTAGARVPGPALVQFAAGVLFAIGLAAASYYGIERPFLRIKDRLARGDRSPKPSPTFDQATPR